jgi:predicted lipoprotein with Yx(FWY)xxD motif
MKPSGRRRLAGASSIIVLVVAVGVLALAASASSKSPTLNVDQSVQVGTKTEAIAVTSRGVAVYALFPETAKHLLCTSSMCLSFWPPVKVAKGTKPTKVSGLKGTLGTLKRKGFTQLTLNGHPLYVFSEDHGKKGEAHGDGVKGFGGTWHVFAEAGTSPSTTTPTSPSTTTGPATTSSSTTTTMSATTTTMSATTTNPYGY